MDTILIIRDSVAMFVNKTTDFCQPCVKEAGTTWQDVSIVFLICLTLLIIALYGIGKYYKCKKDERNASAASVKVKRDNDVEDRKWKLSVDKVNDLQDKLLGYYKDRLIKDKKDDKGNVIVYDEENCKKYVEQLTNMINELK